MNMHSTPVKGGSTAILKNVSAMMTLIETVRQRPEQSAGFGLFYGRSGYGKTVASTYAQNEENCLYIEVREFWTRRDFCVAFLEELGQRPRGTISAMMREIIALIGMDYGRAIIIDEADKLVDKRMIELARDLQEMTRAPVILVGEEQLKNKLAVYERCDGRVLERVEALPCDAEDAGELAGMIAAGIDVDYELLDYIVAEAKGSTRRVANALYKVSNLARSRNLNRVTVADYAQGGA